jgi:hypothetical protein
LVATIRSALQFLEMTLLVQLTPPRTNGFVAHSTSSLFPRAAHRAELLPRCATLLPNSLYGLAPLGPRGLQKRTQLLQLPRDVATPIDLDLAHQALLVEASSCHGSLGYLVLL